MKRVREERKQPLPGSVLVMAKGFRGYTPMEEQSVRKVEVVENKALTYLLKTWERFFDILKGADSIIFTEDAFVPFSLAKEMIRLKGIKSRDLGSFCVVASRFDLSERDDDNHKLCIFLSAVVANGSDASYEIPANLFSVELYPIGYMNTKHVVVHGDATAGKRMLGGSIIVEGNSGLSTGCQMEGGALIVHGNVVGEVGDQMKGGSITIHGDVRDDHAEGKGDVGSLMKGGAITVEGNVEGRVGGCMKGGEIHVGGEIRSIADNIEHGRIFHRGVLIVDK